jgi:peptidoglycan/LPS O-acetylase OafA/YrhL
MAFVLLMKEDRAGTKVEDFFGRASYHLFIAHMTIARALIALSVPANSLYLYSATLALCVVLSFLLAPLEHRINNLRSDIALANGLAVRVATL